MALVDTKLPSPATLKDNPPDLLSACAVVDVVSAVKVNVFLPTPSTRPFTSPTVAALESLPNPLATLVIALLPASIPAVVTDGPPVIWNPVVFNTELPAVKELPAKVLPLTAPVVPSKLI